MRRRRHGPSQHKTIQTLPVGDPDLGAEVEVEITFSFLQGAPEQGPSYASGGQPADPDEVELVKAVRLCNGKPAPFDGAFADLEQGQLDDLATTWLESDEGYSIACTVAMED